MYPTMTICSVKRLMGESYSSVRIELDRFPYRVVEGSDGEALISLQNELITPQEVSANILLALKHNAEEYLGQTVSDAVITVPAYFNEKQRMATKEAGRIAGLNVLRILNEPTAAAIAYSQSEKFQGNIVVFDLGGGTFDISILKCDQNQYDVLANGGDTHLGGDDLDKALADRLMTDFLKDSDDISSLEDAQMLRIREAAEEAKIALSNPNTFEHEVSLSFLVPESPTHKHLVRFVTREMVEGLAQDMLSRCRLLCEKAMSDAGLGIRDIDHVLLVGGTTRMPCVRRMVADLFKREPSCSQEADEIVAIGAAIQGAMISGELNGRYLLDVTPLSLGIMTKGMIYEEIIPPNTTIPCCKTVRFHASSREQKAATFIVAQKDTTHGRKVILGFFDLLGICPDENGIPEFDVTFDLDQDGILTVQALDLGSGGNDRLRMTEMGNLSEKRQAELRQILSERDSKEVIRRWEEAYPEHSRAIGTARQSINDPTCPMPAHERQRLRSLLAEFDAQSWDANPLSKRDMASQIFSIVESIRNPLNI